ncbi:MAG: FecR family protein [Ginsengibacter sp.]
MKKNDRFNYLIQQYTSGNISHDEQDELFELLASSQFDAALHNIIENELKEGLFDKGADLPPHVAQEIIRNIFKAEKNTAQILPITKRPFRIWKWASVAASIIIIALSVYFYSSKNVDQKSFASVIPGNIISEYNSTQKEEVFTLSDGSKIVLQPKGKFYYPKEFADSKREVYLEGEAFFQITKNPKKPFLVYYNNIITKVLGTSFTINTNPKTGNVEVVVKTGRVQVLENVKLVKGEVLNNAVIVTPNQKAIYKTAARLFETTLVEKPEPVADEELSNGLKRNHKATFIYEQEKLLNVFKQIEDRYDIEIITENANLNNCVFTGDVSEQDLYSKLKIICLTTNSSYEINGTKILIKGKGCE